MLHVASVLHFHLRHWPGWRECRASRRQPMTLRIERSARQRFTVFTLSGRMEAEQVAELKELFDRDYRNIILDLRDVRLADRDAVRFLRGCEADGMKLENCPAYVREWMDREKE
jgi:hypothetical protein